jgi:deoxyhypusine synthase
MGAIKDFSAPHGCGKMAEAYSDLGFQASHLTEATGIIREMAGGNTTVFLGFTANLVASGMRGIIKEMCRSGFADAVVTTAGALEHDIMKSHKPYLTGSFMADDNELRKKGINRIGNIFVPDERYVHLERFLQKAFKDVYARKKVVSPAELSAELGRRLKQDSFLYWCSRNKIPVFCPGISDGATGLQMYFFKQEHPDFCVDVTKDMKLLADMTLNADKTGAVILGGPHRSTTAA